MDLKDFFNEHGKVAIAFSGGVDSAYLMYAAGKHAEEITAYYVKTPFQPAFELRDAKRLAEELGIDMKVIDVEILQDERIASNPFDRCYYCKRRIFEEISECAEKDGYSVLLDGTNASDEAGDRPGMKALEELSVLSPLRICGLTKGEIRELSREAGLFTWDKPSYACLATRIPIGQRIEESLLRRTEAAEDYMTSLGFVDFRVRNVGQSAKIQVTAKQMPMLIEKREVILENLKEEYESVLLDLEARDGE